MRLNFLHRNHLFYGLLIILFLLAACQGDEGSPTPTTSPLFEIEEIVPISASGEVVPELWRSIGFDTSGKIEAIRVAQGDQVTAGEELALLDDEPLQLAYTQAKAALRRAEALLEDLQSQPRLEAVAAAKAALASAEANYDRLDSANAREIELEAAQEQINSAQVALDELLKGVPEAQIRSAATDVQLAYLSMEQARKALDEAIVLAPFDGEVIEIYAEEGDLTAPATPLLLLADLDTLQVETTDLSELDVARIQTGDTVEVSFDALPGVTVTGRISHIAQKATPGLDVTYRVVILLAQVPRELRWGMTAFVTINP